MIDDIVKIINDGIVGIHSSEAVYGVAQRVYRLNDDDSIDYLPGIVSVDDGEIKYVGIDDVESITSYHNLNSAALSNPAASGFGDTLINDDTISASLITIWDNRKVKLKSADMMLLLKSRFPQGVDGYNGINQIRISVSNALLVAKQVFDSQFAFDKNYLLPEYINLVQINYNIRIKYDQHCIDKCINCSN